MSWSLLPWDRPARPVQAEVNPTSRSSSVAEFDGRVALHSGSTGGVSFFLPCHRCAVASCHTPHPLQPEGKHGYESGGQGGSQSGPCRDATYKGPAGPRVSAFLTPDITP